MNPLFRRLTCLLMMTAMIASFVGLSAPGLVHAAATCTPQATLPADIPPSGPLDTGANVIATFNNARQQEGCTVSLSIDPTAYDAATPQMQELMLVNAHAVKNMPGRSSGPVPGRPAWTTSGLSWNTRPTP